MYFTRRREKRFKKLASDAHVCQELPSNIDEKEIFKK
jgi:hypothetical protein